MPSSELPSGRNGVKAHKKIKAISKEEPARWVLQITEFDSKILGKVKLRGQNGVVKVNHPGASGHASVLKALRRRRGSHPDGPLIYSNH